MVVIKTDDPKHTLLVRKRGINDAGHPQFEMIVASSEGFGSAGHLTREDVEYPYVHAPNPNCMLANVSANGVSVHLKTSKEAKTGIAYQIRATKIVTLNHADQIWPEDEINTLDAKSIGKLFGASIRSITSPDDVDDLTYQ